MNLQISEVVVSEEACEEVLPPLPSEHKFYLYVMSMSVQQVNRTYPTYRAANKNSVMQTLPILFFKALYDSQD